MAGDAEIDFVGLSQELETQELEVQAYFLTALVHCGSCFRLLALINVWNNMSCRTVTLERQLHMSHLSSWHNFRLDLVWQWTPFACFEIEFSSPDMVQKLTLVIKWKAKRKKQDWLHFNHSDSDPHSKSNYATGTEQTHWLFRFFVRATAINVLLLLSLRAGPT